MTLPMWFLVPFAVVAVLGLVGGAVLDIYSSGLALLAAGLRVPRPAAAAIDGVLMIAGTVYVVFIAHDFLGEFIGFLITLGVPVAAWCGVILADVLVRRSDYDNNDLYRPAGRYGDIRVGPIVLIVVATVLGWGLVTNAGAEWLQWQGYLLGPARRPPGRLGGREPRRAGGPRDAVRRDPARRPRPHRSRPAARRRARTAIPAGVTAEKIRAQDKLAARLFLILHDPFSGRCAVSPMALRCALVGAELAELILNRRVAMANELIVPGEASAPGTDALSAFVVGAITRQPEPYPVPVWLAAIGDAVAELVAARLMEVGILVRTRSLIRRRGRFPAINLLAAAGPRVRLEYMVRTPDDADVASATCAALIDAVGAGRVLQGETSRRDLRRGLAAMTVMLLGRPAQPRHERRGGARLRRVAALAAAAPAQPLVTPRRSPRPAPPRRSPPPPPPRRSTRRRR